MRAEDDGIHILYLRSVIGKQPNLPRTGWNEYDWSAHDGLTLRQGFQMTDDSI
jgi:hypothetical protein